MHRWLQYTTHVHTFQHLWVSCSAVRASQSTFSCYSFRTFHHLIHALYIYLSKLHATVRFKRICLTQSIILHYVGLSNCHGYKIWFSTTFSCISQLSQQKNSICCPCTVSCGGLFSCRTHLNGTIWCVLHI